jgi:copper resistance protein D
VIVPDVTLPDGLSVVLRALTYVLLLQAAGIALFVARFGRLLLRSREAIRRTGLGSAIGGIVAVVGCFALQAPRLAGEMSGLWDLSLHAMALHSASGEVFSLRLLGLSVLAFGLRRDDDLGAKGVIGAALAIATFLLSGHTAVHPQRWLLGPLLLTHLLIVAFWFGALPGLYLASRREAPVVVGKLLKTFSAIALRLVPVLFLAGLALATLLTPSRIVFGRPYGELLLVKVGGFAMLIALAAVNKWRLGPGVAVGTQPALRALRGSIASQYALIIVVLAATAVMTTFFSPESTIMLIDTHIRPEP